MASREELRAQAIDVMANTLCFRWKARKNDYRDRAAAAIDGLGAAGFKVLGPEITDEMWRANNFLPHNASKEARFLAMAAAGDLTKQSA